MAENNESRGKRLPMWVLGPKDDGEARKNLKDYAYSKCHEYVDAMATCSKAHGLAVFPACNEQRSKMVECLLFYQLDTKYLDHERDKVVQKKIQLALDKNKE
ncbi:hypothetical protein TPHA_0G02240 [Tetrapisispora phaffii CBS 4417]|uniref:COX assembly mitochondrial protein n=1 Tax=Tetrapisispora phaffii (strain ATCC 24235 / CBS 4417 / NBRC 1672 / NRRL Y-8282 / UCD 70-5) TaxID=1071381 RepID=G8BVY2_TETPH|nr:hypothetical protein TPHA_0G02240 [Tetrapisispora phaffii CBS 4417]CCE64060.1 hypothetical protein TPHA_0G02240 [Tetrapisispora phaffii CBS 4417]